MKSIFQSLLTATLFVVALVCFYFAWFFIMDSSPTFTDKQRQIGHFASLISGFLSMGMSRKCSKDKSIRS